MKKFLLFLMAIGMFTIAGCGTDTTPNDPENNGACKNPALSEIDLTGNPFSLLGIYNVEAFGKNGEPTNTPSQKSELRVGLNMSNSASGNPEVLMSLEFEGKKMTFGTHTIDLGAMGDKPLQTFIADTFAGLGAEIIKEDPYGLLFELNPATNTQYKAIIDNGIINNGEFLKIKLKKIQNIKYDDGLKGECLPEPDKQVEVTGINITTDPDKKFYKGSKVTIDFELTPVNTTQTKVKWSSTNKGNGEITATNGKGTLILDNVTVSDTITFTTEKDHSKTYNIMITETLEGINFKEQSYQINLGESITIQIENHEVIAKAVESITYSVEGSNGVIEVSDSKTGTIKGLKEGTDTLIATVVLKGTKSQLTARTQIEVLGNSINLNNPDSLKGTYQIEFFASVAAITGGASSKWSKLDTYKNVLEETKSMSKPSMATADANDNIFGEAVIDVDQGNIKIVSKLQMKDNSFSSGMFASQLTPQQYNYTVYTPIPVANINSSDNTINKTSGTAVNGVAGRDAKSAKPTSIGSGQGSANTYYFKLHTDGKLYNFMIDNSVMSNTKVLVVLTKINNTVKKLEPNVQYTNAETSKDIDLGKVFDASEIYK